MSPTGRMVLPRRICSLSGFTPSTQSKTAESGAGREIVGTKMMRYTGGSTTSSAIVPSAGYRVWLPGASDTTPSGSSSTTISTPG